MTEVIESDSRNGVDHAAAGGGGEVRGEAIDRPIFILGCPRSGTTLLASLLHAHPNIAVAPETHFLNKWMPLAGAGANAEVADPQRLWRVWTESDRFSHLGITAERARAAADDDAGTARAVFDATMRAYAGAMGKPRWGEKTPFHVKHLPTLKRWYPRGRFIVMVRDPRAAVASILKTPWGREYPWDFWCRIWARAIGQYDEHGDERFLLVTYERLVSETEAVLREACAHIDEPFTMDMIDNRGVDSDRVERRTGWAKEQIARSQQPINTDSLDKWKRQLSEREVRRIEFMTRAGMRRFGYEPTSPPPNPLDAAAMSLYLAARRCKPLAGRLIGRKKEMSR